MICRLPARCGISLQSPVTAAPGAEGTPLVKGLCSDNPSGCFALFDVNEKRHFHVTGICRRLTAVPYHCSRQEKSIWLDRGATIRKQTGMPWIVLHHVAPKAESGVSGEELEAAELLAAYRPDYFVSGDDHAFPFTSGQSWNQRMNEVCSLVRVNCSERHFQTISSWIPNFENSLGTLPAIRGYPRMGCMII
jgi:hypothetical protein